MLAPFIVDSLAISRTQLGLLITSYQAVGAALATTAGILVDRYGPKRVIIWLCVASLVSVGLMVLPGAYWGLLIAALIAGLANASANPATNRLVAETLPPGNQGIAIGIKQSGIQFAYFAAGALPLIAVTTSWRVALVFAALLPVAGLAASHWTELEPTPTRERTTWRKSAGRQPRLPAGVWWIAVYALVLGIATAAVNAYLVLYGVERLGLLPAIAGLATVIQGGLGIPGPIFMGRATERSHHPSGAMALLAALAFVAALMLLLAPELGVWAYWLAAVVAGLSLASWNSVVMMGVIKEVRVGDTGRASGVAMAGFLAGLTIGPTAFGYTVDTAGSYSYGWLVVASATLISGVLALIWRGRAYRTKLAG